MVGFCRRKRRRRQFFLLCGVALSGLRPGVKAFCWSTIRGPSRTYGAYRRSAPVATTVVPSHNSEIEPQSNFESIDDLQALTVVQLKEELKIRGLKQSGKKADLVRLLASAPGVLGPSPTIRSPSAPNDNVLSDEEVARWLEEDITHSPRAPRSSSKNASKKKRRSGVGSTPPQAVVVEEVVGGLPPAKTFSSSRLGSAEAAKELIKDAELVSSVRAASKNRKANDETGREIDKASSSPGDRDGGKFNGVQPKNKRTPGVDSNFFDPSASSTETPPPPQLPGPTEDMRKKAVILDLLDRRETTFEREEGLQPALVPRSDVYVVSTKKALRPWDGPHADRAETHVVVLLTDVFGHDDSHTRSAADEIAEICDAIVVVPDLFRKRPWTHEQPEEEYEAWRASHDPDVVAADIRACVDFARKEYKPTSLGLVGFCYGGGRALEEAAAGVVKPDNVVVFYPTRYDVDKVASQVACPVAAFFAEHDVLPGATVEDAHAIRKQLRDNTKVSDFQIKLCPGAGHGFAHRPMRDDEENAEDAMLLATSWLDMYMQKHFPTEPGRVKESEFEFWELPARSRSSVL